MRDVWVNAKVMERRKEVNKTRRIGGNRPAVEVEPGEGSMCLAESEGASVGDGEGRVEEAGGMRGVRSEGAAELECLGDMLPAASI
jgi:hypothetical protein